MSRRKSLKTLMPQGGTPFVAFLQMLQELTHLQDTSGRIWQKRYNRINSFCRILPKLFVLILCWGDWRPNVMSAVFFVNVDVGETVSSTTRPNDLCIL